MPRSYREAAARFARRQRAREARQWAKGEQRREARQERALTRLSTAQTHLLRKCRLAQQFPSLLTVRQLRAIAANNALPATARAEAASILMRWAFPEVLDDVTERRRPTRRN